MSRTFLLPFLALFAFSSPAHAIEWCWNAIPRLGSEQRNTVADCIVTDISIVLGTPGNGKKRDGPECEPKREFRDREGIGSIWSASGFSPYWEVYPAGDLDGDCRSEVFLFDRRTGTGAVLGETSPQTVYDFEWTNSSFTRQWEIYPVGDTNGDGKTELFLFDRYDGVGVIYGMDANGQYTSLWSNSSFSKEWEIYPVGDLYGDGLARIFLFERSTGTGVVYGFTRGNYTSLWSNNSFKKTWEIYAAADLDRDTRSELFLFDRDVGEGVVYGANGRGYGMATEWSNATFLTTWEIKAINDTNGDGFAELFLFDRSNGSSGTGVVYGRTPQHSYSSIWSSNTFRPTWEIYGVGNYFGNLKSEMFLFDRNDGTGVVYGTDNGGNYTSLWSNDTFKPSWEIYPIHDTEYDARNRLFLYDRNDEDAVVYGLRK